LESTNKELESFTSIASHDLQEPLRKIVTFGDLLATRILDTDEQSKKYLERMQKSALRMRGLVEDLLQYSSLDTKRLFEAVDLNVVVQTVMEDLATRFKESKGVVNIKNLPVVEADPVQMYQLFLNLIGNALKFHREGIPPIVNLDSVKNENGFWEISVEDNGIGIEEEHTDKIFKPFERLHGRTTYEGTGIGLTICNKIVSLHGGAIFVKRQSSIGVTFLITLAEISTSVESESKDLKS
jgi:light-regulated signal transduction histidine kinase (bacteriophytochrome)